MELEVAAQSTELRFRSSRVFVSEADLQVSGLRTAFDVERTLAIEPNEATISIWNLNRDSRTALQELRTLFCRLEVGYGDNLTEIFSGDIQRVWSERAGPDIITRLSAGDAETAFREARIAESFGSEQKFDKIFERIVRKLVSQTKINGRRALKKIRDKDFAGAGKQLARGFVVSGKTMDELERLARSGGLEVSVQNGELQVLNVGELVEGVVVELSPETGLLGSPTLMPSGLIQLSTLMIPDLAPGVLTKLRTRDFSHDLRMERGRWVGDTRGESWGIVGEYSIQGRLR